MSKDNIRFDLRIKEDGWFGKVVPMSAQALPRVGEYLQVHMEFYEVVSVWWFAAKGDDILWPSVHVVEYDPDGS